jgi:hypothetical protein
VIVAESLRRDSVGSRGATWRQCEYVVGMAGQVLAGGMTRSAPEAAPIASAFAFAPVKVVARGPQPDTRADLRRGPVGRQRKTNNVKSKRKDHAGPGGEDSTINTNRLNYVSLIRAM